MDRHDYMYFHNEKKIKAALFTISLIGFLLTIFPGLSHSQVAAIDWEKMAGLKPDLKVMVQIKSPSPISLEDLAFLAQSGMVPADREPAMVLGLNQAVFTVKLKNWVSAILPPRLKGRLLDRFVMTGIYRVSFEVERPGYEGPLSIEVTAPRNDFGKRLLSSESMVRPRTGKRFYVDLAGNRWFCADYAKIRQGEIIRFHFAFKYLVDMAGLLQHDLMLLGRSAGGPLPEETRPFLASGRKIDLRLPWVIEWARAGGPIPPVDVRSEYLRVKNYIKKTIAYDSRKKVLYFGGKSVYSNLDDMYRSIPATLSQRLGACPDTSLVECAFLRARGIPCRTAGRFGHFLTHLYVSGQGWMSTLIHPTGIPLIVAPGPDNVPYQRWRPSIPLKTVTLDVKKRIEPWEELP
jgi:Transglutaminase-like superfamily